MATLVDSLECLVDIRYSIQSGNSVQQSISNYIDMNNGELCSLLRKVLMSSKKGPLSEISRSLHSQPLTLHLINCLLLGLQGTPILSQLVEIEKDMKNKLSDQIDEHLRKLPVLTMIPVLFFILPSFLILLIGPIIIQLLSSLGG